MCSGSPATDLIDCKAEQTDGAGSKAEQTDGAGSKAEQTDGAGTRGACGVSDAVPLASSARTRLGSTCGEIIEPLIMANLPPGCCRKARREVLHTNSYLPERRQWIQ